MSTPADVRLEDVVKRFEDTIAVDGISLDIPHGSFFALLGPSGCGKTTTLRMIGGFEQPTSGTIFLGDQEVERPAAVQARRQHGVPELRALPAPDDLRERRVRARGGRASQGRDRAAASTRCSSSSTSTGSSGASRPALGRPAAAGRARPRARQPAAGAAARRAARCARPQAAQADAARAEAHPAARSASPSSTSRTTRRRR